MPDDVFARVACTARRLGLSPSELLTRAVIVYLDQLDSSSLSTRIDAALEQIGPDDEVREVVAASKRRLRDPDHLAW